MDRGKATAVKIDLVLTQMIKCIGVYLPNPF